MPRTVSLQPSNEDPLSAQLFRLGVEFPCAGASACGSCRFRLLSGHIPITPAMREVLSESELDDGWRLACCAESGPSSAPSTVTVELPESALSILTDEAVLTPEPRPGIGLAVDLGTTTVVAQLVGLTTGSILAYRAELNAQARHGSDLMSRIAFDLAQPGRLTSLIRSQIAQMAASMLAELSSREDAAGPPLVEVLLCGNTVMHHLYCGFPVEPLAAAPFRTPNLAAASLSPDDSSLPAASIEFLPCLGGFAGSDLLCGIVATGLASSPSPCALIDLGTNGEVATGSSSGILCASTAAGPAFEAGLIRHGMRAGLGAIDRVRAGNGALHCHVIGGAAPLGLCGSGLVDSVASSLELGLIAPNGRFASPSPIPLAGPVALHQSDVRQLQLAKGATAAALHILGGASASRLFLAGAFGNYLAESSARAIGLIPPSVPVTPAGNAALRGLRLLLLQPSRRPQVLASHLALTRHVELAADPSFEDLFAAHMRLAVNSYD